MRLDIYVNYRGNCEQAFRFYEQHLGGRITGIVRHREQPNPRLTADWQEKVLHARIEIGTTVLMGADIPQAEPMRSVYLRSRWIVRRTQSVCMLCWETVARSS